MEHFDSSQLIYQRFLQAHLIFSNANASPTKN